ncbi:MAG: LysR family transcriptional regulator [Eubacterium sp.]|nr:LysR family transcriptional regulator [Eubacterium sp.]
MDLNQMQYYIQVYEDRKISKAAEHLYVSQQYISRVIQKFETDLGVELFVRTKKGLIPTREGEETYRCLRKMLDSYHDLLDNLKEKRIQEETGRLRVVLDIGLVQLLSPRPTFSFTERYPKIELGLEEHRIFNCKKIVGEDRAELGLSACVGWHEDFANRKVLRLQTVVLMKEDHPLARKVTLKVSDLVGQPLIFSGCPPYYSIWQEFDIINEKPNIPIAINELTTVYTSIKKNLGIAPLVLNPRQEAPTLPKGIISIPYETIEPLYVYAYWKEESPSAHLGQMYADYLADYFK